MELFEQLYNANHVAQNLSHLIGQEVNAQLGIVTNRDDPQALGRIKATIASQGGRTETDWLFRNLHSPLSSPPVPNIGDTVLIGYLDGDSHKGFYYGVLTNNLNPAADKDTWVLQVGASVITVTKDSIRLSNGLAALEIHGDRVIQTLGTSTLTHEKCPIHQNRYGVAWTGLHYFTVNGQALFTDPDHLRLPDVP